MRGRRARARAARCALAARACRTSSRRLRVLRVHGHLPRHEGPRRVPARAGRRGRVPGARERAGFRTELEDPTWIGKGYRGEWFVDLIFSSGNGVAVVDDLWFEHARPGRVMGVDVLLAPPEEMIWSKGFVLERERYDGADVNHLLRACGRRARLGPAPRCGSTGYWEVLFSHLMLFRFAYPVRARQGAGARPRASCSRALRADRRRRGTTPGRSAAGTLISRVQYRHDLEHHGYEDGRALGRGGARGRTERDGGRNGAFRLAAVG